MPHFGCPPDMSQYLIDIPGYPPSACENGAALIKPKGLKVLWSNGGGWEHVSVSRRNRTPSYEDMDFIKRKWWWNPEHVVMQLHVGVSNHINCHQNCLHLWRPLNEEIPTPPNIMVGV